MNIAFIGYGNMAKAITQGLIQQKKHDLAASAPSLSEGKTGEGIRTHYNNAAIAASADVIILAVKPKQMETVLTDITPVLQKNCLLVSVAAGLTLSWLASHCSPKQAIVRGMPNTPASVGQAATPLIANSYCTNQHKQWTTEIFSSIGMLQWITDESELDTLTALSGSGPAYVFKFMEAMISAAKKLGLNHDCATSFTLQTIKGALALAEQSTLSLSDLRQKVTSPNGTTAAALDILNHGEFDDLILAALKAAQQRSVELGKEF